MATYLTYLILCILVVLVVRVFRQPGIALALVWSMFTLEQLLQSQFSILLRYSWLVNVAIGGICLVAACRVFLLNGFAGYQFPKQFKIFVGLFVIAGLSYFWCVDPETTYNELKENAPQILTFGILAPICVYRPKELKTAITVMVFFGGLILVTMFFSNLGRRGIVLDYVGVKQKAVEANALAASQFAGYVGICAVFSIYGGGKNALLTVIKIGITLLALLLIVKSGSRGQLIAMVITCFVWLPFAAKIAAKRSTIIALVFACLVVIGGIMLIDDSSWGKRWQVEHMISARDGRLQRNLDLLKIYADSGPLVWFAGLGSSASYELVGGYPHNVPNEVLTEEGLIGFGLLVALVLYTFRDALASMRSISSVNDRINAGILLALFSYDLLLSLKQGSLVSSAPMFSFAVTLGWIAILLRKSRNKSRHATLIQVNSGWEANQ